MWTWENSFSFVEISIPIYAKSGLDDLNSKLLPASAHMTTTRLDIDVMLKLKAII